MLVSVIVPVYNSEKYLEDCINSILNQSYNNIEILLIDDHSEDRSADICKKYVLSDIRVHYFLNKGQGVSAARNMGLNNVTGSFIMFVDSDDLLKSNSVEIFLKEIMNYDLLSASYAKIYENDLKEDLVQIKKCTLTNDQFITGLFSHKYGYLGYCWGKLFKREIIEDNCIRFNEKFSYNEDRIFVLQYVSYCNNICLMDDIVYCYRQRPLSLMARINTDKEQRVKNINNEIDTIEYMLNFLREKVNIEAVQWGEFQLIKKAYKWKKSVNQDNKVSKRINNIICKYEKRVFRYTAVGIKDKLRLIKCKYL